MKKWNNIFLERSKKFHFIPKKKIYYPLGIGIIIYYQWLSFQLVFISTDAIRESSVVDSEFGGITQHIGAYQVKYNDKKIRR